MSFILYLISYIPHILLYSITCLITSHFNPSCRRMRTDSSILLHPRLTEAEITYPIASPLHSFQSPILHLAPNSPCHRYLTVLRNSRGGMEPGISAPDRHEVLIISHRLSRSAWPGPSFFPAPTLLRQEVGDTQSSCAQYFE